MTHTTDFAHDWIAAWNSHDLTRILSHYADDFEMRSPAIVKLLGVPSGVLVGKERVGSYWAKALAKFPDLKFELLGTFNGVGGLALRYHSSVAKTEVVEVFELNSQGLVVKSQALYQVNL